MQYKFRGMKAISNFLKRYFYNKLFVKLSICIICISVIPLMLITIVLNGQMVRVIENELLKSHEYIMNEYVSKLNYKIDIYTTLLNNITSNKAISDLLTNKDNLDYPEQYDKAMEISKNVSSQIGARRTDEINNITIYSLNEENQIYVPGISNVYTIKNTNWYKELMKDGNPKEYLSRNVVGMNGNIISFIKPIINIDEGYYGERIGFIKLDVNAVEFFSPIFTSESNKLDRVYIVDKYGKDIYHSTDDNLEFGLTFINNILENNIEKSISYMNIENEKVILAYDESADKNFKIFHTFDYSIVENTISSVRNTICYYVILVTIIVLGVVLFFSQKLSKRVNLLLKKMDKVKQGDIEITEYIAGNDEIATVDQHFNIMVNKLKKLINQNYIQNIEKKEAELNSLQLQINPHFLYNTLETISSLAAVKGCFEICEISQRLGEMFRYNINVGKGEFIYLEQEIKHIENYVYIQKIRFNNKFEVFFDIDDEFKKYRVLKFILQPFIENAILHGINNKNEHGCIEVSVQIVDNKLAIIINDDGVGIDIDKLNNLNNYINNIDNNKVGIYKQSIGMKNVNMRIKLTYGNEYGVVVTSDINKGTKVIITLPAYEIILNRAYS